MTPTAEQVRDWRRRNPDKVRAQQRAHRLRHKAKLAEKNKDWREANPGVVQSYRAKEAERRDTPEARDRRKQYSRDYYGTPHGRSVVLVQCARRRAKKKGLEFCLTVELVEAVISAGFCQVTGLPFSLSGTNESFRDPWAPSLDRTDTKRGYTTDNVKVVVCMYNIAKSDFAHEDLIHLAEALTRKADK